MVKRVVKSKKAAEQAAKDINRQREEFRLLAGEWATGHPVFPPALQSGASGGELEKWNSKLDEMVDDFIDALRMGTVEKEIIARIPPAIKKELDDVIKESVPGGKSDLNKKPVQKTTEKPKRTPEKVNQKPAPKKDKSESQETTDTDKQPESADDQEEPTEDQQPKSKFENLKKKTEKFRRGVSNLGKIATTGARSAIVTQSPFLRNILATTATVKTAFSGENTSGEKKTTGSMLKQATNSLFGIEPEKKPKKDLSTTDNKASIDKAKSAESSEEASDNGILEVLKKIEENTRGEGKEKDKKEKKNPLKDIFESAKKLASGFVAALGTLVTGARTAFAALFAAMSSAGKKIVEWVSKLFSKIPGRGASKGGTKKPSGKVLPPRDPKTGRFITKEAAAKLAAEKGGTKAAAAGAAKTGTSIISKAAGVASKGAKFVPGLSTAMALGTAGMEAYEAKSSYDSGDITEKERNEKYGEAGGGASGAIAGAALGAAAGSFIPVVGTAIGGIVGGVAGYMGGSKAGGWLGGMFGSDKKKAEVEAAKAQPAAAPQVVPKLEQASSIISNAPEKPSAIEEAVAQTNDSVQKLATTFAQQVNTKSNVATQSNTTVVSMRNSARDHDSTFRRYLTDRTVFA